MSEFFLGLVTLPALIITVAGAAGLVWLLWGAAQKLNESVHRKFVTKLKLPKNRLRPYEEDERPLYESAANTIRDSLLNSPKLYLLTALGWHLVLVRDSSGPAPIDRQAEEGIDEEAFLNGTAGRGTSSDAER